MIRAFGRLPIALRVPLMGAGMMVLVGLVASQQVLTALTRAQEARLEELTRQHVDGLSVALGPSVLRQDVWEVFDVLDRASRAGEARRMVLTAVADANGRIIAATDPFRAPVDGVLADLVDLDSVPNLDEIQLGNGDGHVRVLAPLVYQGRDIGRILTELDVSDLAAERAQAAMFLLVFNAATTGGLAIFGYVVMRRMLRPIGVLTGRMSADRERPARFSDDEMPRGDTEVARLFRTYNAMADAIGAKADAERRLAERERLVSLGRLSSSLAHEINNPLGGLLNAADTIETYADRPEAVRSSAALLRRGLLHLRDVARAALDHNRIEGNSDGLGPQDMDDLRLLIAPEVRRLDQRLDWNVSVAGDDLAGHPAGPVRQIVLNLLLNAIHAAGHGGRVSLRVRARPEGLNIEIGDDGPGLPETALQRLLTSEPTSPGGGLGLRVVRDLVGELGGCVQHARGDGMTTISVSVPGVAVRGAA